MTILSPQYKYKVKSLIKGKLYAVIRASFNTFDQEYYEIARFSSKAETHEYIKNLKNNNQ